MKNKALVSRLFAFAAVSFLIVGCNVFAPFQPDSSDEDHLEAALACLNNNGNYPCALTEYAKLSPGAAKEQNLCMVDISQAGMTLSNLVNVLVANSGSSTMLGSLANATLPWSQGQETAAAAAAGVAGTSNGECQNYYVDSGKGQLGQLLDALSYMADCTARMARTATQEDTGDNQYTATNTTSYGKVTKSSICFNSPACTLSAGTPGLSDDDANACSNDIQAAGSLNVAGLSQISKAIAVLNGLNLGSAGTAAAIRNILQGLLAN